MNTTTNKTQKRDKYLQRTYGISLAQFTELLKKQQGVCAICHKPPKPGINLCVDHEHVRGGGGVVRGLLCNYCNRRLIGRHKDPELFRKASEYLSQDTGWYTPKKKPKKRKKRKRK